jgi:hypothetical protein
MHFAHIRHLFHIPGKKITITAGIFFLSLSGLRAQDSFQQNLPFSDSRWLHYGFSIGLHSSGFKMKYSSDFVQPGMDSLHSIMPKNSFGFSLGFITDFRLHDQVNFRILPKVSFYEFAVDFNSVGGDVNTQLIEATFIEMPLMIKYKTQRHKNFRMYVTGGLAPGIEVSGKKRKELTDNRLLTGDYNLAAEAGFGIDMYFPLFKFSPEFRFSRGLFNILREDNNGYSKGIQELKTNVFTIYLQFSD